MEPLVSNNSANSCGDVSPSGCIPYNGSLPSCIPICKGDTLNDVIYKLGQQFCYNQSLLQQLGLNILNVYPTGTGCLTGQWIDFSSFVPTSGGFGSGSFIIDPINPSLWGAINNVSYKWLSSGDLLLRGGLSLTIIPSGLNGFFRITLATIPANCFPSGFTKSATKLIGSTWANGNFIGTYLHIDQPTNSIQITGQWNFTTLTSSIDVGLSFDGTQFNLN